jgi:hypothetical protein
MARAPQAPATPLEGAELAAWLEQVAEWHAPPAGEVETFAEPPSLVPRTATPLYKRDLARMFANGHELATGRPIGSKRMAECALAIIGVENANGRAIIQYNWGNYSCTPTTWSGPMWQTPVPQSGQPLYFRAYSSHEEGCAAWWRLMYRGAHRRALEMAARGRPDLMVDALYASHYVVGGSQSAYRRNACLFAKQYRRERLFFFRGLSHYGRGDLVGVAGGIVGSVAIGSVFVKRWADARSAR